MRVWHYSRWDALLFAFSLAQAGFMLWFATTWDHISLGERAILLPVLVFAITYNIIAISHPFTHASWFAWPWLNSATSALNSVNIGQSVQAYEFSHVRNHHRYNNDAAAADGTTRDTSSTYRNGADGEHAPILSYAFGGALASLGDLGRELGSVRRLWRVGASETAILSLASPAPARRRRELRQIQLDRAAHFLGLVLFLLISWQWVLVCYLPAFYLALTLVNVQNYYRHYGARPADRLANSVSYYGRIYNFLAFNDGYHQEHHLSPKTHWSRLPAVREKYRDGLDGSERIVSPVPAMLGFMDRRRPLLHRDVAAGGW